MTNQKKLFETAKEVLGKDLVPDEDELACAAHVNAIFKKAFGKEIGGGYSTYRMYRVLLQDARFSNVSDMEPGDVIISPTGYGNGKLRNGHVGIVGESGRIMSNNSFTGRWEYNYDLPLWKEKFANFGGFPVKFFRVLGGEDTEIIQKKIALLLQLRDKIQQLLDIIRRKNLGGDWHWTWIDDLKIFILLALALSTILIALPLLNVLF